MGTKQSTADYIAGQCSGAGRITVKKMFGEYGLYCDGQMVALICDDQLFVKPIPAVKNYVGDVTEGKPYPGANPYILVPGEKWDDADWLAGLVRVSAAAQKASSKRKKS